jgi:hypothetical protein
MAKGTDLVREMSGGQSVHADLIDCLKEQLLIVFLKRLGGHVDIPVKEVDDTGKDMLYFNVTPDRVFHFSIQKKGSS